MARKQITKRSGAPQIKSPYKRCEKKSNTALCGNQGSPEPGAPRSHFGIVMASLDCVLVLFQHGLLWPIFSPRWMNSNGVDRPGESQEAMGGKKTSKPASKCFVLISMVSRNWSSRLALKPASNFVSSYNFLFLQVSIPLKLRGLHRRPAERQRARTKKT